ncbi:MAG: ABC transporter ATP-binding protein/permease [Bacteroidaceae bacterium]|nr:ABC transporter ATP-binding protein/permease [Bacteroidaceae bacterium]
MNIGNMKSNTTVLRYLWTVSKGLRLQSILNAAIGIVVVALDFAFIYFSKLCIDLATGKADGYSLRAIAVVLLCIIILQIIIRLGRQWISAILGIKAQNKMQRRLFRHLLEAEWNGLEERHSGDLLNRLERDVRDVTTTITETIPATFTVTVRFMGAFYFLFTMSASLALIIVLIIPCFALLSRVYVNRMRRITRKMRQTDSEIQSLMQESVQHSMVLKTLEQVPQMLDNLDRAQTALLGQVRKRTRFSLTSGALINFGFTLCYLTAFLWGVNGLKEQTITYGMMTAFLQLVGQIQGPFRDILRFVPSMISTLTAGERLMEIEESPMEIQGRPVLFEAGAGIRITDVCYTYPGGHRKILENLNCDFPIGSHTAILGETGAGKTTLIRLILALTSPQQGSVEFYNGKQSVAASPLTRCNLVYVPQANTLFCGTIRSNLLLGNPQATEAQMHEALHQACADFVFQLEEGLDTRCGENGNGLSEGQNQRICIARALLRNGNILLLDEATSALDTQTEVQLLGNLQAWMRPHQTLLFITHRPGVLKICERQLHIRRTSNS